MALFNRVGKVFASLFKVMSERRRRSQRMLNEYEYRKAWKEKEHGMNLLEMLCTKALDDDAELSVDEEEQNIGSQEQRLKLSLDPFIVPVPGNNEMRGPGFATPYKVVHPKLIKWTDEYDYQCSQQLDELVKLSGPTNLQNFGLFRRFVQTLIVNTRNNVCCCRRNAFLSALKALVAESIIDFEGKLDLKLIFSKREYKTQLKFRKKNVISIEKSWDHFNNQIFDNWKLIEDLMFIKGYKGASKLGFTFDELYALLQSVEEPIRRFNLLKSAQVGKIRIYPVFQPHDITNKSLRDIFSRFFSKKDRRRYWIHTENETYMVDVEEKHLKYFVNASLSALS